MVQVIPECERERNELEEDLKKMRCTGLLVRPWALKNEDIVQELIMVEQPNMFEGTIRDRREEWTAGVWKKVYIFPAGGSNMASWIDTYSDGKVSHVVDPKDRYPVRDSRDAQNRRSLEFIVPIIHPDKSTRMTITIGNTIFGALNGGGQ